MVTLPRMYTHISTCLPMYIHSQLRPCASFKSRPIKDVARVYRAAIIFTKKVVNNLGKKNVFGIKQLRGETRKKSEIIIIVV